MPDWLIYNSVRNSIKIYSRDVKNEDIYTFRLFAFDEFDKMAY